jgi:hypothetical protein
MSPDKVCRHIGLDRMQPHGVLNRIVYGQRDEINLHNPRKPLGEIAKELIKVPLRSDRLCDLKKSLVAFREILTGRDARPAHT